MGRSRNLEAAKPFQFFRCPAHLVAGGSGFSRLHPVSAFNGVLYAHENRPLRFRHLDFDREKCLGRFFEVLGVLPAAPLHPPQREETDSAPPPAVTLREPHRQKAGSRSRRGRLSKRHLWNQLDLFGSNRRTQAAGREKPEGRHPLVPHPLASPLPWQEAPQEAENNRAERPATAASVSHRPLKFPVGRALGERGRPVKTGRSGKGDKKRSQVTFRMGALNLDGPFDPPRFHFSLDHLGPVLIIHGWSR